MIQSSILNGVEIIINLGAGLDTRPYRMDLPPSLVWIEVDYPHILEFKKEKVKNEKPKCLLKHLKMDLLNRKDRQDFFSDINAETKKKFSS